MKKIALNPWNYLHSAFLLSSFDHGIISHLPFCVQGRCKDGSCERNCHGLLQQNLSCPGSAHGFDSLRPDLGTKESVGKCPILRISKTWKLVAKEYWNLEEKMSLELCDVASHVRSCHLSLVSMTPCAALQSGHSGSVSAHLRGRRSTPHYLTDLWYQVSTSLCNHMYLKHHLWEWLLPLHQLDVKGDRSNLRGWERGGGKCREHENSLGVRQEVNWTGGGKFMEHQDPI